MLSALDLVACILSPPIDFIPLTLFPSCCTAVSCGVYLKLSHLCWNTSLALTSLLGSRDIPLFISQQQLTFVKSITSPTDLPQLILEQRLNSPLLSGIIPHWQQLLDTFHLPSFEQLISTPRAKASWKNSSKRLLNINHYIALTEECLDYPIGYCNLPLSKPCKNGCPILAPSTSSGVRASSGFCRYTY